MKRLIFFVMVLCSTVFSAENIQIAWQNDWKEVGTHGNYRAEWTKKIMMPEGCNKGVEQRLDEIVLVSTNVLNKKPTDWLNGKYFEYVNTSCDIWDSLRGTPEDFEKIVDQSLKSSELGEKEKYKVYNAESLKKHEESRERIEEKMKEVKNAESLKKHEEEKARIEEKRNVEKSSKVGFLFMAVFVILVGFYMIRDFLWGKRN